MKEPSGSSSRWESRNEDYGSREYGNRDYGNHGYGRRGDRYQDSKNDQGWKRNGDQGSSHSQRSDYNGMNGNWGRAQERTSSSSRYYNDSRKRSRDDVSYDRSDGPSGRDGRREERRDCEVKREKREPEWSPTERMTAERGERRYGYQDQPAYNNWNPQQLRRTFPKKKSDLEQRSNHWQHQHDAQSFDDGIVHGPMKEGYGSTPPCSPTRRDAVPSESRKAKSESPVPLFNDAIDYWPMGFAPGMMPVHACRKTKSTSPVKRAPSPPYNEEHYFRMVPKRRR